MPASPPPRKRARLAHPSVRTSVLLDTEEADQVPDVSGEIVPVLGGTKTIHVHKSVLIATSSFLKNAVKPEWLHTDTMKPVDLSDEDADLVQDYCQWLYSRKLIVKYPSRKKTHYYLAKMYVFGEKLMDETFQNTVLDAIIAHSTHGYPPAEAIKVIYDGTSKGSPARDLMVDFWAYSFTAYLNSAGKLHLFQDTDFLEELVPVLFARRGMPDKSVPRPWVSEPECYHAVPVDEVGTRKGEDGGDTSDW